MSEDKWIVDYETPDGTRQNLVWETERMADDWLSYHRGQNLLFNITKCHVTNFKVSTQERTVDMGKPVDMEQAAADALNKAFGTQRPAQVDRALHGQLGTHGTAAAQNNACPHCGLIHATTCWRIKAMEYYPDGTLKSVEFHEQRGLPFRYRPLDNRGNID